MGETKTPTHRTFEIVLYETNPKTGEALFSEQDIIAGLKFRTITRWAYILHDKDVYSEEDEARWNKQLAEARESPESWSHPVRAGEAKPRHWHIVLYCRKPLEAKKIAEWFGVPEELVGIPKGNGAFWTRIEHITHESMKQIAQGTHRYADEEVKSNVQWREELDTRIERKKRYKDYEMNAAEKLQFDVLANGLTMAEAMRRDPTNCMKYMDELEKLRMEYLSRLPPPKIRTNYYVEGPGGIGKSLICRALARSLCPDLDDDSKIFFEAGLKGAPFEGYDGQRVIIWEDRRAADFLDEFGNVLDILDTRPTEQCQNKKYGSIARHAVNIISGVQPFEEFMDALAEDKNQIQRRFPFIVKLREDDFKLLLNKGYVEDTRNYEEYMEYENMRKNLQQLQAKWANHRTAGA